MGEWGNKQGRESRQIRGSYKAATTGSDESLFLVPCGGGGVALWDVV